jgi:hypothetical protein
MYRLTRPKKEFPMRTHKFSSRRSGETTSARKQADPQSTGASTAGDDSEHLQPPTPSSHDRT